MKMKLIRVKLVNWHIFSNETIMLNNNVLFTGNNGSGKSTILDAMQFVLTAGKSRKFNLAANFNSGRNLESYVRGKLGVEGKEYLRASDVVGHIALEFYDALKDIHQVLGVVIEQGVQSKTKTFFYTAGEPFTDDWFLSENRVNTWSDTKRYWHKKQIKVEIPATASGRQSQFMHVLGLDKKYMELVPKALAFTPVDDVDDFIYRYLLNDAEVDIHALRDSIRDFQLFELQLSSQRDYFNKLEIIHKLYNEYSQDIKDIKLKTTVVDLLKLLNIEEIINTKKEELSINKDKALSLDNEIILLGNEKDSRYKELQTLLDNDAIKHLKSLKISLEDLQSKNEKNNTAISIFEKGYSKLVEIFNRSGQTISKLSIFQDEIKVQIRDLKVDLEDRKEAIYIEDSENKREQNKCNLELKDLNSQLDRVRQHQQVYPSEVKLLINLLNEELSNYYGSEVKVKPLFEYLEINDESWRNAIEGYLNTQRFNLIIDPKYFDYAAKLYKENKEKFKIYGVRIIDVMKTKDFTASENSLALELKTLDDYSRGYINYLLGRVICVDDVSQLKKHNRSITKDCMVYQGYSIYAIRPEIYSRPFIGQEALRIREKQIIGLLEEINNKIHGLRQRKTELNEISSQLKEVDLFHLESILNHIKNPDYFTVEIETTDLKIKSYAKDLSVTKTLEMLKIAEEKYSSIERRVYENNVSLGVLKEKLAVIERELESYDQSYSLQKQALKEFERDNMTLLLEAESQCDRLLTDKKYEIQSIVDTLKSKIAILTKKQDKAEKSLIIEMMEYNQLSKSGFSVSIAELDPYLNKFYQLRDLDLVESINRVRLAKEKSQKLFEESFIHQLKKNILKAKDDIRNLNTYLESHEFRDEKYSFVIKPSKDPNFAQYYKIITSGKDMLQRDLFTEQLSESDLHIMEELFRRITMFDDSQKGEQELRKYTDYRRYMSYDIKVVTNDNEVSLLSNVIKEKSGGETQTPFYVTIASSFEQLIPKVRANDSGCVVLFDEAFNNMDSNRIKAMLEFYKSLDIQTIVAVPPERIASIQSHIDTLIVVDKQNNQGFTHVLGIKNEI